MSSKETIYKKIEKFMGAYYKAYNQYGQDAGTIDKMDQYWAPEFKAIAYFPVLEFPTMDLVTWKKFIVGSHMSVLERINLDELYVDTKEMAVTSKVNIENIDRKTNELLLKVDSLALYNLKVDKKKNIKIISLKFFCADPVGLMELFGMIPTKTVK